MKSIKYVIWGAGIIGKKAFNAIGEKNVEAFVDSDAQKVGESYCCKRIIDLDQYIEQYSDCLLLIAIKKYGECCKILEEHQIYSFVIYKDIPSELRTMVGYQELKAHILNTADQNNICGIKGMGAYSLIVYDWIRVTGKQIQLIINKDIPKQLISIFDIYEVSYIFEDNESINELDVIFLCDYINKNHLTEILNKDKRYRYIFDCAEEIEAYHNPKLDSFKNIHKGKRCFIVATGPSLTMRDLDILNKNDEICFSVNSIFKAFDKTEWRPDYYFVADRFFMSMYEDIINELELPYKFVGDQCVEFWEHEHDSGIISYHYNASTQCFDFSQDVSRVSYAGNTVTYICMQFAVFMGFKEIYLVGVDCNYDKGSQNNHFIKEDKPDYIEHNTDRMLLAYQSAKHFADEHDIKFYNATRGGKLEIFERVDFDSLFSS